MDTKVPDRIHADKNKEVNRMYRELIQTTIYQIIKFKSYVQHYNTIEKEGSKSLFYSF